MRAIIEDNGNSGMYKDVINTAEDSQMGGRKVTPVARLSPNRRLMSLL